MVDQLIEEFENLTSEDGETEEEGDAKSQNDVIKTSKKTGKK